MEALWENFLITERLKRNHYHRAYANTFFWRTKQQQEIDYLEEADGRISAFEFKWNENKKSKVPTAFSKAYPNATFEVINKQNYLTFLTTNNEKAQTYINLSFLTFLKFTYLSSFIVQHSQTKHRLLDIIK